MKKMITIIITLFILSTPLLASDKPADIYNEANINYKNGNYNKAVELYKSLCDKKIINSKIYYNLGNSYFKAERIGYAILYYEKALKLSPGDDDIKHNLLIANARKTDIDPEVIKNPIIEFVKKIMESINWKILRLILSISFILTILLWIIYFLDINMPITDKLRIIMIPIIILLFLIFLYRFDLATNKRFGIVIKQEINIHSGPSDSNTIQYNIHEGLKVKINKQRGNWYLISIPNLQDGWVSKENIEII